MDASPSKPGVFMPFLNIALLFAFAALFSGTPSSAAGLPRHVRSYIGRDSSKWIESASSFGSTPNLNAVVYAGGEYNISIAKTTVDAAGNIYAIGSQLVTVGSYTAHTVFVTKIDPTGAAVYITRLGGKGDDIALGVGVDASGRVFGGGYTTSPDFPPLHALQTDPSNAGTTGFVFALDASGNLLWSTYFGGSGTPHGSSGSSVKALAVDPSGNAYVTGTSQLPNLPTTPGAYQGEGHFGLTGQISNGFVSKFSPTGQLVYSTWPGGNEIDCILQGCIYMDPRIDAGTAIAVDSAGSAYVAGYTDSSDFPVTPGAFQATAPEICSPNSFCTYPLEFYNAFLTKLKPDGSGLVYSTFLGSFGNSSSPPPDGVNKGLALDTAGDAYVAFGTTAVLIPITFTGGLQTTPSGGSDILLLALNPVGSALTVSTYLGGSGDDFVTEVALDSAGDIYVSGTTASANFPDLYGLFPAGSDFVTELNSSASKILFSARLPGGLAAQDVALVPPAAGAVIAAGSSGHIMRLNPFGAASFPALLGAGNAANGTIDSALSTNEVVTIYGTGIGPTTPVTAQPTPHSNSLIAASYPESLGGVQVSFNGQAAALLYVSSNQINLGMPYAPGMPYGLASPVVMMIVNNGATFGPFAIAAASEVPIPGIFRNADGSAAALNQDGTLNTQANPAHAGGIVTLWGTGVMGLVNGGEDGGDIPAQVYNSSSQGFVSLYAGPGGSYSMPITYAGGAPGLVGGVFQINAQVPQGLGIGPATIYLQASGINSPFVTIYVAP
jgi:uncharacterized protein (TIGR03437 family)